MISSLRDSGFRFILLVLTFFIIIGQFESFAEGKSDDSTGADKKADYVVVVSKKTNADAQWQEVVGILRSRYQASVVEYQDALAEARQPLAKIFPRYACFVATPEEANRDFVISVHRLTRTLDNDPYTDVKWAILTGYTPGDALRIARHEQSLIVRKALSGTTGVGVGSFAEGYCFNEGAKGVMWEKKANGPVEEKSCPEDSTKSLVDAFNEYQPDAFFTSGHATTNDWQIGYNYRDGQFRCKDGQLFGLDTQGNRYDINSANPKVFLPVGNCLIGRIPKQDCMALALMRTGGVNQMFGYTVVTWHGYGGWGVNEYFTGQAGRFTLAESFYANSQALIHQLETRFPRNARLDFDVSGNARDVGAFARKYEIKDRDELGLLWDRDTVAFYGDPAWEARVEARGLPWEQNLSEKDGVYTFEITSVKDGSWGSRPVFQLLPHRVKNIVVNQGEDYRPVITDNFILVPLSGKFKKGEAFKIVFHAEKITAEDTAALAVQAESPMTMEQLPVSYQQAVKKLPDKYKKNVLQAFAGAGDNKAQLLKALTDCTKEQQEAVAFLIANMPERDLKSLSSKFILNNVKYACQVRKETPWSEKITDELFLNYILPYANLNERRDDWREDFHERFLPMTKDCKSISEAVLKLNKVVYETFKVKYHATKRPKPDQSPYESTKVGYASCTGLSILLSDACRAVGIPARVVGTPAWTTHRGNHTWVEIWDGKWHFIGASEQTDLNETWFGERAAKADPSKPEHRIYAASFGKTDTHFPLVWDWKIKYVSAVDVTSLYTSKK